MISQHLEDDHAELDTLFEDVMVALAGGDCPDVFRKLDLFWARLAMHIRAEHRHLFPAIRSLDGDDVPDDLPTMLDELRHDHDFFMTELARAIKAMRLTFHHGRRSETLVDVANILQKVRSRLDAHNRTEETKIYRLATEAFLTPEAITNLKQGIDVELTKYPDRFREMGKTGP